jgi:3-methylcrotonyl-CoA carboxylase alpha subunit
MAAGAGRGPVRLSLEVAGERRLVTVEPVGPVDSKGSRFRLSWDDTTCEVEVSRFRPGALSVIVPSAGHASYEVTCYETAPGELVIGVGGRRIRVRVADGRRPRTVQTAREGGDHAVVAPMPGRVVRVEVAPGDTVQAGQGLAVVEAMKMENEVTSPAAGVVSAVRAAAGDVVESGAVLVVVSASAVIVE